MEFSFEDQLSYITLRANRDHYAIHISNSAILHADGNKFPLIQKEKNKFIHKINHPALREENKAKRKKKIILILRNAFEMGLPYFSSTSPAIPAGRFLVGRNCCYMSVKVSISVAAAFFALFGRLLRQISGFLLFRHGRRWYQEIYAAPFELGLRWEDQNPADHALRAGFRQDMIRVVL